jgi:hypothetical protein
MRTEQHLETGRFLFLLLTTALLGCLSFPSVGRLSSLGSFAGLAGLDAVFRLGAMRLVCSTTTARPEVVLVENASIYELARGTRGDELAIDGSACALRLDICNAATPHLNTAELCRLQLIELIQVGAGVSPSTSGHRHGRCCGCDGSLLGVVGLNLLDNLVATKGNNSDTDGNTTSNHELRAEQQGGDSREAALEGHEHPRAHLTNDGADLGEGEGDGSQGLRVLLQVLDGLSDRVLEALSFNSPSSYFFAGSGGGMSP